MSSVKVEEKKEENPIESHLYPNLDYKPKLIHSSKPKIIVVNPSTGSTATLSNNITNSTFTIQRSQVYMFSKSSITFDLDFPLVALKSVKLLVDRPPISSMRLKTQGGTYLMDIDNFGYYWKMTRLATPKETYQNNGSLYFADTSANSAAEGNLCSFHNPGRDLAAVNTANMTKLTAANAIVELKTRGANSQNIILHGGDGTTAGIRCRLDFAQLNHTILQCPKDFPCVEDLQLDINWAPKTAFVFMSDAAANIDAAEAYTGDVALSNLRMQLVTERDQLIKDKLMMDISGEGITLPYPYPRVLAPKDVSASTSSSNTHIFNTSHGTNLLRVYSCEFSSNETLSASHNSSNIAGSRISSVKVWADGDDITGPMNPAYHEDYRSQSTLLSKSCVDEGDFYSVCPATVTTFSGKGDDLTSSAFDDFDKLSGIDIKGNSVNFMRDVTNATASAQKSYTCTIGQKVIRIAGTSINEGVL